LPPIEVYFGSNQMRRRQSQIAVAKSPVQTEQKKQKQMTPQPSGFKINLVKISPAESSDDELEDFVETPKIKKLILKGAKKEPEVIPKILIDRSSYNMLL